MKGNPKLVWIGVGLGCLAAIWGTVDVLRGESTPEVLVFTVPILVASLCAVLLQFRHGWPGGTAPAAPAPDAAAGSRRIRHLRRLALVSAIATITLATFVSVMHSSTVAWNLLIGAGTLVITCTIIILILRPSAQR